MIKDGLGSLCYQGQWSIYDQILVNNNLTFAPDGLVSSSPHSTQTKLSLG